jgi:hypothetical protein
MDMETLIPFAIRSTTGELVSVDEVESGAACECICLSCEAPMVARKGPINQHHFAHMAKATNHELLCDFNLPRALKWLAADIFQDSEKILLPGMISNHWIGNEKIPIEFAKEGQHGYQWVDAKQSENDSDVNVQIIIENSPLKIILGLSTAKWLGQPDPHDNEAVLLINLATIAQRMIREQHGYRDFLANAILNVSHNKHWLSHPRLYRDFKNRTRTLAQFQAIQNNRSSLGAMIAERVDELVELVQEIYKDGDITVCKCALCHFFVKVLDASSPCPACRSANWDEVSLTPGYVLSARVMFLNLGYGHDSLKYALHGIKLIKQGAH